MAPVGKPGQPALPGLAEEGGGTAPSWWAVSGMVAGRIVHPSHIIVTLRVCVGHLKCCGTMEMQTWGVGGADGTGAVTMPMLGPPPMSRTHLA